MPSVPPQTASSHICLLPSLDLALPSNCPQPPSADGTGTKRTGIKHKCQSDQCGPCVALAEQGCLSWVPQSGFCQVVKSTSFQLFLFSHAVKELPVQPWPPSSGESLVQGVAKLCT